MVLPVGHRRGLRPLAAGTGPRPGRRAPGAPGSDGRGKTGGHYELLVENGGKSAGKLDSRKKTWEMPWNDGILGDLRLFIR